jgi:LacI family transcriptional regulator
MAKVTIDDISRETGLSRGTVSRALNNRPDISAATRQRVLDVCVRLHYTPSRAARSLALGRHFSLVALLSTTFDPITAGILRGAAKRADASGYSLNLIVLPAGAPTVDRIRAIDAERLDGLLLMTPLKPEQAVLLRERLGHLPIVSCFSIAGITCDVFTPDLAEAGRLAARSLLTAGARSVAHLRRAGAETDEQHRQGFSAALTGAKHEGSHVRWVEVGARTSIDELARVAKANDGIACAHGSLSAPALMACATAARVPGRDLSLIGYGAAYTSEGPQYLTVLDPAGDELGSRATETLIQRIDGERRDEPHVVRIAPSLVSGSTVIG